MAVVPEMSKNLIRPPSAVILGTRSMGSIGRTKYQYPKSETGEESH